MVILCSRLYNPEEGGAGEICIFLTWVMILMGAERSQESVMKQLCDGQHLCLHVRLSISVPNMGCLPPGSNAHKVFSFILCIVESENLFQEIRCSSWIFITGTLATMVPAYRTMEDLKWWCSTCSQIMCLLCLGSRKLSWSAVFLLSIIHADRNESLPQPLLIKWKDNKKVNEIMVNKNRLW
jgi:hypothetical protein